VSRYPSYHRLTLVGGKVVLLGDEHWTLDDSGLIRVYDDPFESTLLDAYSPGQWRTLEGIYE
jgi:hypothetical protein